MTTPRDRIEARLGLTGPPLNAVRDVPPAIPDHELVRRIGQGAYGEVWLARNALATWRAVKIVYRDNFKDERPYEREFAGIRRFEPLSRSNEGFVDILQIGRDDAGGWFYYVMELADDVTPVFQPATLARAEAGDTSTDPGSPTGKSALQPGTYQPRTLARDLHQRGRLPLADCLELGLNLTLALGHLHRHGLIHRDIKPSNIIFVGGVPKLADIGLVTEAEGANTFVGTEGFVPPEGPTSPQADLYALGKVLYEAAMGKDRNEFPEPFTQIGTDLESISLMELNAVLLRACAPDPKKRYASAEEMHADLALLHSGGSVKRRHQFDRQFQIAKQVGAVAFAAMLLIGGAWFWQRQQTQKMTRLAEEKSELADANARLANEKDAAARESHGRLLQVQTANGLRAMEENHPATAALWFAEVLQQAGDDTDLKRRQRDRLSALFCLLPKPIARLSLPHGGASLRTSADGRWVLGVGAMRNEGFGPAEVRIWDAASLRPLHALGFSNVFGRPLVSPSGRSVVVAEEDGKRIWDLTSGAPLPGYLEADGYGGPYAWSPDETKLATVKQDGTDVYVMDASTGRRLVGPLKHTNTVFRLAFDPTGRWLVTGTIIQRPPDVYVMNYEFRPGDWLVGQARVWDATTGQPLTDPINLDDPAFGVEFSPDGSAVAVFGIGFPTGSSAEEVDSVKVLDLPSGRVRFAALSHKNKLLGAGWSPDSRYLATCTGGNRLTIWNAHTGEPLHRALQYESDVPMWPQFVRFSPDGSWVAAGGTRGVHVWEVRSGATVAVINRPGMGRDFTFSSDGAWLITLSQTGSVDIWNLAGAGPAWPPLVHEDVEILTAADFSPDGKSLCTVDFSGHPRIWDVETGLPRGPTLVPAKEGSDRYGWERSRASWSPDGSALVVRNGDSTARLWDVARGTEKPFCLRHEADVLSAEFSPDGHRIVTSSSDFTARLWDASTGSPLTRPLRHENRVNVAHFSRDGRRLVTASFGSGTVRVWDAVTGAPISPPLLEGTNAMDGKPLAVLDADISPDGERLAMGGWSNQATVRDAVTGEIIGAPMPHQHNISTLKFSPDGRRLLTTSADRTARVWDASNGTPISPPLAHQAPVTSGDFSPDGLRLITGCEDGTARVWDATTGEPLGPRLRHEQRVTGVSFSPDGRTVASASADGTAQLWDVSTLDWTNDELLATAQLLAGARIGASERIEALAPSEIDEAWGRAGAHLESRESAARIAQRWHRQRLGRSEQMPQDWLAAEFHARRLAELHPEDPVTQAELQRVIATRPPARARGTPPELIDLSPFYNAALSVPWHGGSGNHLAELPRGIQAFAGTRFDVRGLVQVLGTPSVESAYPEQVTGIPIHRTLERLQFLHATQGVRVPDGTRVGHYLVRFANGRREEIPILYGRDARDWHEHSDAPAEASGAIIAWRGNNPATHSLGTRGIRLFKRTWINPAPEVEVSTLDFVAEHSSAHPFLVALTAE